MRRPEWELPAGEFRDELRRLADHEHSSTRSAIQLKADGVSASRHADLPESKNADVGRTGDDFAARHSVGDFRHGRLMQFEGKHDRPVVDGDAEKDERNEIARESSLPRNRLKGQCKQDELKQDQRHSGNGQHEEEEPVPPDRRIDEDQEQRQPAPVVQEPAGPDQPSAISVRRDVRGGPRVVRIEGATAFGAGVGGEPLQLMGAADAAAAVKGFGVGGRRFDVVGMRHDLETPVDGS